MKKFYFLPFLFLAITGFAQKQFVVQGGTVQTFDNINAAIAAASKGDTIYLPGGGFNLNPTTIDKPLHWRGVGHYPDSTSATGFTSITNGVAFTGNCDSSTFEGIYFVSSLTFGTLGNEATEVSMKRCRIGSTLTLRASADISGGYPDLNFRLTESVVTNIDAKFGKNVRLEKNLVFGALSNFYQSFFNHNSINANFSTGVIRDCNNCQFLNNVFSYHSGIYGNTNNCNFQNNLFQGTSLPTYLGTTSTHTGTGNISGVAIADIYSSVLSNIYAFDYANDYHLKTGSPGIGAATDGTNIGVYGTSLPYKPGAVPYAPHIRTASIDNEAVSGNLGVQIKVAAQER